MEFGGVVNVVNVGESHAPFNYVACLSRLKAAMPVKKRALVREVSQIPAADPSMYGLVSTSRADFRRDRYSTSLVHQHMHLVSAPFTAAQVTGDGSCLFHSASLLISGEWP